MKKTVFLFSIALSVLGGYAGPAQPPAIEKLDVLAAKLPR
jgi:hypothetical protein